MDRSINLHQHPRLDATCSHRTFAQAFKECFASVRESPAHECIAPDDVGESNKSSDAFRVLIDQYVVRIANVQSNKPGFCDFIKNVAVLADVVANTVVWYCDKDIFSIS